MVFHSFDNLFMEKFVFCGKILLVRRSFVLWKKDLICSGDTLPLLK